MRICINAAAANQGGAVTYLLNLLPQLAELDTNDRYLVVAPESTLDQLSKVLEGPRIDAEIYPHPPGQFARRVVFDQFDVPAIARRYRTDLLFSVNGFGTLIRGCPEILLVRNSAYFSRLLEEKLRELGRSPRDLQLRRAWSLLCMRMTSAVLFPAEAMQKRVEKYISFSRKPTQAIHYGFDRDHFFTDEQPSESVLSPLREWKKSGRQILLYVSGYAVHKNFETAVEGLASLLTDGVDVGLVTTAEWKPFGEMVQFESMLKRIRELGIEEHIFMPGGLPWSQLHAVYAAADIHLWPTFLESFGHPMVEAMASGLPTVAADTDINREILCEAAVYFDPFDQVACARAIRNIIEDADVKQRLKGAAEQRARHFSWQEHAKKLRTFFGESVPALR